MSNSIKDTICKRKSVRTFDGRKITAEDKSKLEEIIRTADNPFGVPVDFMLLDAKENGHSGRFAQLDPQLDLPENTHYIISYERTE
jgi:hypothetical protein